MGRVGLSVNGLFRAQGYSRVLLAESQNTDAANPGDARYCRLYRDNTDYLVGDK